MRKTLKRSIRRGGLVALAAVLLVLATSTAAHADGAGLVTDAQAWVNPLVMYGGAAFGLLMMIVKKVNLGLGVWALTAVGSVLLYNPEVLKTIGEGLGGI